MTLFFTLVMTALVCILLGCGVPTTANYIIMVTVAAPALGLLGVAPIVAHFFVFYYGVLADITPPVALAAYAGASMAGADPFRTGNTAFRLGLGKVLVPFVFAYGPAMLIVTPEFTWPDFLVTVFGCVAGITLLSAAFAGYALAPLRAWERWLVGLAAPADDRAGAGEQPRRARGRGAGPRPPGHRSAPIAPGGPGLTSSTVAAIRHGRLDRSTGLGHMRMNVHSHYG